MRRLLARLLGGAAGPATSARLLAVGLALLAPLAPPMHSPGNERSVVYVLDRSRSVGAQGMAEAAAFVREADGVRGSVQAGLVTFGRRADLIRPVGASFGDLEESLAAETRRGSDLAGAVRLAAAALPAGGQRRIVVLSDGRDTSGDPLEEVRRAREEGIEVDVVPIGGGSGDGPSLATVRVEHERVAEGEPVEAIAEVQGPAGSEVRLWWVRDSSHLHTDVLVLDGQGRGEARLVDSSPGPGPHVYQARLFETSESARGDGVDSARALAIVEGRPRVLVLSSIGDRPALLLDALAGADAHVDLRTLDSGEPDEDDLSEVDLVVLADVAIARSGEVTLLAGLSSDGQQTIIDYVSRSGGGLLVLGGSFGFGPEYSGTPLARLLPVEVQDMGEVENPRVSLAIMLDRSGSMGAWVGGHSKMQLAIEASLAAVSTLRGDDRVAIAAVDEVTSWYFPLGPAAALPRAQGRIRSITAGGGGIFVYTALADAYAVLRPSPEPIHHVIIFSDTADSEEQYQGCPFMPCSPSLPSAVGLARTARAAGITTSAVGIGSPGDSDTAFLRNLAAAGGGRFYMTTEGTDLRRIFIAETRAATRSNLREEPVQLERGAPHPALVGIDVESMPAVLGFVESDPRGTADTALLTPEGHPVLASWRYGLGTVSAWTTDAGERWTRDWGTWEGAGQLMRQITRFTMRRRGGVGADARVVLAGRDVEVIVEAPDTEGDAAPAAVELSAIDPTGRRRPVETTFERVAPGRWVGRARTTGAPFVHARIRDGQGRVLAEAVGDQQVSAELSGEGPDRRALGALARAGEGVFEPSPAMTVRAAGPRGLVPVATWPWLLLLAGLIVAGDLWIRRLGRRRSRKLSDILASAPARAPSRQQVPTHSD